MFALISSEELEAEGRLKVKQLKNRYNDPTSNRSFVVGIDRAKMKLFDVADSTSAVYDAQQEEDAIDAYDTVKQNQARLSKFAEWNV
jgi:hypothetical protein